MLIFGLIPSNWPVNPFNEEDETQKKQHQPKHNARYGHHDEGHSFTFC